MRVVVTGASGYIGARLALALAESGAAVTATGQPGTEGAIPHRQGIEPRAVAADDRIGLAAAAHGTDVFFHLAGVLPGAPVSVLKAVNVDGAAHAARAAIKGGVQRFVFLSSTAVYLPSPHLWPLTEAAPLVPVDRAGSQGYGQSKVAAEDALRTVSDSALEATIIRASTVYGPGSRSIEWLVGRAGAPVSLRPGSWLPALQWVFVDDLIRALIAAALPEAAGLTLNVVGSDLASAASLIVGAQMALRGDNPPLSFASGHLRFSYQAAAAALAYQPTPLAAGLRHAVTGG
jgi:nucleoside-diphosphate-sugar epimerase